MRAGGAYAPQTERQIGQQWSLDEDVLPRLAPLLRNPNGTEVEMEDLEFKLFREIARKAPVERVYIYIDYLLDMISNDHADAAATTPVNNDHADVASPTPAPSESMTHFNEAIMDDIEEEEAFWPDTQSQYAGTTAESGPWRTGEGSQNTSSDFATSIQQNGPLPTDWNIPDVWGIYRGQGEHPQAFAQDTNLPLASQLPALPRNTTPRLVYGPHLHQPQYPSHM